MFKWQICYTEMASLFTVHNKCLKIHKPQCILQLVCEDVELFECTNTKNIACGNKEREITHFKFYFNLNLMFKWQICYTEMASLFTVHNKCLKIHKP